MVNITNISNHRALKKTIGDLLKKHGQVNDPKFEVKLAGNASWNLNQSRPLSPDMLGCRGTEVIGSMVGINGLFHLLLTNEVFLGAITH